MKSIKGFIRDFPNGRNFAMGKRSEQNPVVRVSMRFRTKEEWKKLLKQAKQNANKNVYDHTYVRE